MKIILKIKVQGRACQHCDMIMQLKVHSIIWTIVKQAIWIILILKINHLTTNFYVTFAFL